MNTAGEILEHAPEDSTAQDRLIRFWLVDDNAEIRKLISSLVETEDGFQCARQFPSADAALGALKHETPPDVILMDIEMPGLNGVDAVRQVKALAASTQVYILTTFYDHHYKTRALRDGASGFYLKGNPLEDMFGQIRRTQEHVPALTFASCELQRPETPEISDRDQSSWPMRRAPALSIGRSTNDGVTKMHPDTGRRKAPWHCASSRLVRGVSQLRGLFRMTL
jgi:DNA-binding NarL/FixJ family response regulator